MIIMLTELHCHSIYSKGRKIFVEAINSPEEMLKQAKRNNTEAISITDHDTIKGSLEAKKYAKKYDILVIPGEEISSKDGDILALGIEETIKPTLSAEETIDIIHTQGGIAISAHPFDLRRFGLGNKAVICDAIEVFNAQNIERISNWKARRLVDRHNMPVTAGSDAHSAAMLGKGLNNIKSEKDIDSVLKAIKKGRNELITRYIKISEIREWSVIRLKYSFEQTRYYINQNYKWPKRELSLAMLNQVKKSPGKIDYALNALAYFGIGCAVTYRVFREVLNI